MPITVTQCININTAAYTSVIKTDINVNVSDCVRTSQAGWGMATAGEFQNVGCSTIITRAVLSQGGPRDAAVNFDKKNLQRHRAVSVPQHGFSVGL